MKGGRYTDNRFEIDISLYSDKVFKYKGVEWELFGSLKHVRSGHESILLNGQGEVSKWAKTELTRSIHRVSHQEMRETGILMWKYFPRAFLTSLVLWFFEDGIS